MRTPGTNFRNAAALLVDERMRLAHANTRNLTIGTAPRPQTRTLG